jgi:Na+/H+ antiporter NhaA
MTAAAESAESTGPFSGRTAWARNLQTPLRQFVETEIGGAAVLLVAAAAALIWINADAHSYDSFWSTVLSIDIGDSGIALDLRQWVNSGLMTLFFFVVGLEARREFDLGELRERRRFVLPLLAALGGLTVPVAIYLAFNAGEPTAEGWGVAMSTDTAFALGLLALVGPRFPARLRAFMLTIAVVDDIVALIVIAVFYSDEIVPRALVVAILIFSALMVVRATGVRNGIVCFVAGAATWVAVLKSGVDPIVVGLVFGLVTFAYPSSRTELERATERFRAFREQPTPELARIAQQGLRSTISPNERLQQVFHPWTSYLIVPIFALANAGVVLDETSIRHALSSPVTLGIIVGYVVGKPVGIAGVSWLATRLTGGRLRPPVGWAAVIGGGTIAGIGFTVSLLVASIAFEGETLSDAKIGIITAALIATLGTWLLFSATARLPRRLRIPALAGGAEPLTDLYLDVDPERDHTRGPDDAPVTIVEYGDFQCPFCGQAEPVIRQLLAGYGDLQYVWRHLPLNDVHVNAQLAAEASEAAADQGAFWEMYDLLLSHQDELQGKDLVRYAEQLGLDVDKFTDALRQRSGASRVAEDVDSADLSGVSGTPTFFINGRRHYGAYDIETLTLAVQAARARASLAGGNAQLPPG